MKLAKLLVFALLALVLLTQPVWAGDPIAPGSEPQPEVEDTKKDADQAPANSAPPTVLASDNDLCENAVVVPSGGPFPWTDTRNTSGNGNEGDASCNHDAGADEWYLFTPSASRKYTFSTCDSSVDTVLTVYTGSCGALAEIACNDDYCGYQSFIAADLIAGTTYYIRIAGYQGASGSIPFKVELAGPEPVILSSFNADPAGKTAWGLGYRDASNTVWVGDWTGIYNREFSAAGAQTGKLWSGFRADMEYDAGRDLMYQVDPGHRCIRTFNPATGVPGRTIFDPGSTWGSDQQRGVAYDPATDTLYVGGWYTRRIYHIQGLSGANPGAVIKSWSFPDVAGLAWLGNGRLVVVTNRADDAMYIVDAANMTILDNFTLPGGGGYAGAGTDAEPGGACWVVNYKTCKAYRVSFGQVVSILNPTPGEVIASGSTYTVTWAARPAAVRFEVKYSLDNGVTWSNALQPLSAPQITAVPKVRDVWSYQWKVPAPRGNNSGCRLKVVAYDAGDNKIGVDVSKPFTIEVVRLTAPNGAELLTPGDAFTITWQTNATKKPVTKVKLVYTLNNGVTWLPVQGSETLTDTGSFAWTVPTVNKEKNDCRVKVVLKNAAGVVMGADKSDDVFTIRQPLGP